MHSCSTTKPHCHASDRSTSYFRFSGRWAAATVGATVSITPPLVVTVAGLGATSDAAGPLLVSSIRPGCRRMLDDGGRTSIRRAGSEDVTMNRCWASSACRCCSVRPARLGIIGRPAIVCTIHTFTLLSNLICTLHVISGEVRRRTIFPQVLQAYYCRSHYDPLWAYSNELDRSPMRFQNLELM